MVGLGASPSNASFASKIVDFPVTVEDLKSYLPPTSAPVQITISLSAPNHQGIDNDDDDATADDRNKQEKECHAKILTPCFKMEFGRVAWLQCLQEISNLRDVMGLRDQNASSKHTSAKVYYNIVKSVLKGSALATFTKSIDEHGPISLSSPLSNKCIDKALYRITCLFFPGNPMESLKYTLRSTLVKPNSMSVSTFYFYVQELISFLPLIADPSLDNEEGTDGESSCIKKLPSFYFNDIDEYKLFSRCVPRKWVEDYENALSNTNRSKNTQDLISHLQMTETIEVDRARESMKKRSREFIL